MKFDRLKQLNPAMAKDWWRYFSRYLAEYVQHPELPLNYPYDDWRAYDLCHAWSMKNVEFRDSTAVYKLGDVTVTAEFTVSCGWFAAPKQ